MKGVLGRGGRRVVSPTGSVYTVGLAWSRDGTMILARNFGAQRFETINVATGVVAPIANTSTLFGPGW